MNLRNPKIPFWNKKKVIITGHTGFKGSWLSYWLLQMGANIYGISLEPITSPNLFEELKLQQKINHHVTDITNQSLLEKLISDIQPDIIFHMAAQPLVIESYLEPLKTWETNVMGTFNLLNSLKFIKNKCVCICITTDKVYRNNDRENYFKETDPLGGHDPYSSSKAAAEIAIESFRSSFCGNSNFQKNNLLIASVRSGNVIGGGDWSDNRIIPDLIRSIISEKIITIRNPDSVRPWQHVLDPLSSYLKLAEKLFENNINLASSFNFGPNLDSNKKVLDLVHKAEEFWPVSWKIIESKQDFHEARFLGLNTDKAKDLINWEPRWDFDESVKRTFLWYKNYYLFSSETEKYCKEDLEHFLKS
ncbi:CDP-glucose 4,6-dehydratase [Prochlorococcus marinus]|uniref:CDP-glucose 4,6-dehydratase n=1 Tax=Prochlorococcus marinus TaxID=1219 RepID=UPI0039C03689